MTGERAAGPEERCRREVVELHRFFEDWFCGRLPRSREAFARFRQAMSAGFRIVDPSGRLRDLRQLETSLWEAHGCRAAADDFVRIRVERVEARALSADAGIFLVTYDEWHETPEGERGRRSSALLRPIPGDEGQIEWVHVHETWLPPSGEA